MGYLPAHLQHVLSPYTRGVPEKGLNDHLPTPTNKPYLGPFTYFIIEYLPDFHTETSLADYHYPMTEKYGHAVRLKGGMFGVSSPSSSLAWTFLD